MLDEGTGGAVANTVTSATHVQRWVAMDGQFPSFDPDEVALLVSAVEQSLRHLREANEREGGNDAELIEYGRRYSVVLQKLEAVAALGAH